MITWIVVSILCASTFTIGYLFAQIRYNKFLTSTCDQLKEVDKYVKHLEATIDRIIAFQKE